MWNFFKQIEMMQKVAKQYKMMEIMQNDQNDMNKHVLTWLQKIPNYLEGFECSKFKFQRIWIPK